VYSSRRGSRDIEHIGSAHDDAELALLRAAARQRLAAGQGELDLGLERTEPARRGTGGGPLPITSSRMGHLLDALEILDGARRRALRLAGRRSPEQRISGSAHPAAQAKTRPLNMHDRSSPPMLAA
jgi:hypothetical protein